MQAQTDASISDELRQVANGFAYRVRSFTGYDVNGYRFHLASYKQSRPNRRTTNSEVFTPDTDGLNYYGRIEEIYEEPQIAEFLRSALMASTIMEELKKYTNFYFIVANLLILSYSNAIGLILE
jgi:hypothetical protein